MKKGFAILLVFLCSCTINANVVKDYGIGTQVYFCPREDCKSVLLAYLNSSDRIDCAFYDLDIPEAVTILRDKHARLVIDNEYYVNLSVPAVIDSKYSVMHNKFCILDNQTVLTGSMNPTIRDTSVNNNNLLVLHSEKIAALYEKEFQELYSGTFSGGEKTPENATYLNNERTEVYFCPEDWCANKILYRLNGAEHSIYFAEFSFTHSKIADVLVKKKNLGLDVKGVMEKSQNSKYCVFQELNSSGIPVFWDTNKGNMHHKFMVIDGKTVITGSMNPSIGGDTSNDENILIIDSPELAAKYSDEFSRIYVVN